MPHVQDFFYRVKLLDRHLFAKIFFFNLPSKKNFLRLKIFENFAWKNFRPTKSGFWGAGARRVFDHKTPSYTSSNHQNIALIWQTSQKDDFHHYFFLWECDLKMTISLNEPQMFDITVALRPIWWGFVSENSARSCTPKTPISLVKKFFKRNFRRFSSAKMFFLEGESKKNFFTKSCLSSNLTR